MFTPLALVSIIFIMLDSSVLGTTTVKYIVPIQHVHVQYAQVSKVDGKSSHQKLH